MGRSKFPGKPSKLVNKKRVSVLQTSENNLINYENDEYLSNDQISLWNSENETTTFGHDGDDVQNHPVSQTTEKPPSSEPPDGGGKNKNSPTKTFISGVVTRARTTSHQQSALQNTSLSLSSISKTSSASSVTTSTIKVDSKKDKTNNLEKPVKKKTVTFKNVLETSDDAGAIKKVYNPDNAPLVPIIKKECLSRSVRLVRSDCIVRPSRLTEILKNNANNIDKLNFLKFRSSSPATMDSHVLSLKCIDTTVTTTATVTTATVTTTATTTTAVSLAQAATVTISSTSVNNDSSNNHDHHHNIDKGEDNSSPQDTVTVGDKRFILPKRSAHSCRVIKPNKRFLDETEICTRNSKKSSIINNSTNNNNNNNGTISSKKLLKKQQHHQEQANEAEDFEEKSRKQTSGLGGLAQQDSFINTTLSHKINNSKLNEENGSDTDDDLSDTSHIATDDTQSEDDEDNIKNNATYRTSVNNIFTSPSNKSLFNLPATKVILRQPRLQYDSQIGLNQTSNASSPLSSSPFSLNLSSCLATSPLSLGSSNICGVCETIINSKVLQQSRKYGIFSCEACRKFISKTIKKLASTGGSPQSSSILQCNQGDGSCIIAPLLKGNIKNIKKTNKERCPACWLKKCTKSFHVPSGFKNRLNSIIPASLRDNENNAITALASFSIKKENSTTTNVSSPSSTTSSALSSTSLLTSTASWSSTLDTTTMVTKSSISSNLFSSPPSKLLTWTAESFTDNNVEKTLPLSNSLAENNATFGGSPLILPTILEKPVFILNNSTANSNENENVTKTKLTDCGKTTNNNCSVKINVESTEENLNCISVDSNKIKLRRKEREITVQTPTVPCDPPKRQRIDLKGPRVKHVCRSASIVLGQPIATFPNETSPALDSMDTPPRPESPNNAEVELADTMLSEQSPINCSTCTQQNPSEQELGLSPPATPIEASGVDDECSGEINEKIDSADATNSNSSTNCSTNSSMSDKENKKSEDTLSKPLTRKITRPALIASNNTISTTNPRNLNSFSKKLISQQTTPQKINQTTKISIDFWENYDPAEVSQTGFGIIVTESIPMRALCFLCGSTGLDPLIFCACCCEPYHPYCVEDEYNLKHSSLDDTMTSLLDASINPVENVNIITNRLNWLCPRCTVCYTCNMSSGSKVKCQKCQKNYHTTCLGTSKRLLGADRPLICANCLKCKSCSTTKVTKFVGNLPMCLQCFKLRKKGNFCPLCQKCYEDNDFDLKMMECGDCQRWVHAKCEGLSDEQYNLLSTLPENIEFICKRCSKANLQANLWREAVASEFKSGLLSVVKLLSKSRQACALLKLSPRKSTSSDCICQPQSFQTARSLQFKKFEGNESSFSNDSKGTTDEESQNSEDIVMEDVYEFKETPPMKCFCGANQKQLSSLTVPSLVDIKRKINSGEYVSLAEFNYDMNNVITAANCDELMIAYKEILSESFPWFQNETKACTDALEEDMFDSCTFSQSSQGIECDQQVPVIDLPEDIEDCLYSPSKNDDSRICMFCKGIGEGEADLESRLLYCGQNSWVHINCAMWSAEVFEEIDGSLQNVHSAIARGRLIKCSVCGNRGATVGCNIKSCGEHYHYPCARRIECAFMTDKTVYCFEHIHEANKKHAGVEKNFEVLRPVYVELDRKKKKLIEPSEVKFLIGSLEVKKVGKIFSKLSDTNEAIVPVDFLCTRLYWSIREPWKIVEYTVKTSVQNNFLSFANDSGKNFTVDHSNSINKVQRGLSQITRWHNSLMLGEENDGGFFRQERSIKQILEAVGQNLNSEEATEEEPQNNADLLPPEIKDAIFEDLPHEILDGISMLDIFPKLMIYEDVITIDSKAEGYYANEYTKDGSISDEYANDPPLNKDLELSNGWPISSGIGHVEDAMLSAIRPLGTTREIKRSKSEVFPRGIGGNRSQQRSSSLTSAAVVKRRKISKGLQDIRLPEGVLLSIGRRKEEFPACLERRRISQNEDCRTKQFTWSAAKKYSQNEIQDHMIISRGDSTEKLKISQLDGMDDLTGESDFGEFQQNQAVYDTNSTESPVKCDRCNCTYRTHDSYQRHLATCEPLSTSESESEAAPRSPEMQSPLTQLPQHSISLMQSFNQTGLPITSIQNGQIMTGTGGVQTFGQTTTNIPTIQNVQIQNGIPLSQINQGISNIYLTTTQNSTQQQTTHQTLAPTIQQQQFLPTVQNFNQFTTVANPTVSSTSQTISISTNGLQQSQQPQILTMSTADGNQQVLTIGPQHAGTILGSQQNRGAGIYQKPQLIRGPVEKIPTKIRQITKIQQSPNKAKTRLTNATKPIQMKKNPLHVIHQKQPDQQLNPQQIQIINQNLPGLIRNQADNNQGIMLQQNTNSQPMIVQQVGNNPNNLVSYVTASDGHNSMQYVTMPTSNDFKQAQTPFLTTSPLMQGAFLQTDSSGNLVLTNASSGLQMLSAANLQIAQPNQPQVIGTLIQPQTGAIQCGVMSAEQMVLGGTPTLEMVTNPTMLLTSQPVYYGLETIVQNTVMSSQQFVSTAMQGVLSQNASFSATTTQVFQASKIEPIMEVPAGYVVLNNDGTIMQQPSAQTNIISTNVLQQPTIQQIHTQPQQIHTQTVQPQQINGQQIQPLYNIQQQQQQQQQQHSLPQSSMLQQQQSITTATQPIATFQAHHIQPQLRAVSPAKPTAKSSPLVITKIQPQIINKVVPNMSIANSTAANQSHHFIQDQQKSGNPIILSKTVAITSAVDTSPIIVQTASTGVNNIMSTPTTKVIKSSPITMAHHHPLKPKTNSMNLNPSLMHIQPVQRKMNMIRPLNKVTSSSATSNSTAVTIKPKVVSKPVSVKTSPNGKISMQSPPLIAPKPQQVTTSIHNQKLQQQQIISRSGGAGGIGQVINEQQLLEARKNLQAQLAQADSTADLNEQNNLMLNGTVISQAISTTFENDVGLQQMNIVPSSAAQIPEINSTGSSLFQTNNLQYTLAPTNQTQTINLPTSSSSIQLPSAPFISPYGNNIPTNVVNPIQQVTQNIISRPTNRVLPMQTIQQKLMSPPTPPEPKLCIIKPDDKEIEQDTNLKEAAISSPVSTTTPQFELLEKSNVEDFRQQHQHASSLLASADGSETSIIYRHLDDESEKMISIELRINDETINIDPRKSNDDLKLMLTDSQSEDNEFDMRTESDGIADQDDLSESTTPEVKEKICEILENLENEDCNKSPLLEENYVQNEPMMENNNDVSDDDLLEQQKENVDPMPTERMKACKSNSISPMKVSDFMGIQHHQQQQQKPIGPRLLYEIQSEDGFTYKSTSITEIWEKVFEAVQVARKAHGLLPLPEGPLADMCGVQMLGLKTNALRYLIEQLPGVERCSKYTPKYHKRDHQLYSGYFSDQEDLKENSYGAARCEPFSKRSEYDMFSWLASRHRKQPIHVVIQPSDNELIPRRGTGSNLPMAMKYRTLKETYKDYVGVFRSHIHGRGLYCTKDIESGEMVIEYAGELIRSTLTDKRERFYDSKGIGCYMFKIDENLVVDATMRGNAARFINHSCEPNCYSKVVDILGHKHIIIFALRRIVQGEELTYDYKFPFEDVKIPCSCGSKKCRKYLN